MKIRWLMVFGLLLNNLYVHGVSTPSPTDIALHRLDCAHIKNRVPTLQMFKGHAGAAYSVMLSIDGKSIFTEAQDGTARTWDVVTGKLLQTFRKEWGLFAVRLHDKELCFLSSTGEELLHLGSHDLPIINAYYTADGCLIATVSPDGTACIWEIKDRRFAQAVTALNKKQKKFLVEVYSSSEQYCVNEGAAAWDVYYSLPSVIQDALNEQIIIASTAQSAQQGE